MRPITTIRNDNIFDQKPPTQPSSSNNNKKKAYGFCEFAQHESAVEAIRQVDGQMLLKQRLVVKPAKQSSQAQHSGSGEQNDNTTNANNNDKSAKRQKQELEDKIAQLKRRLEKK